MAEDLLWGSIGGCTHDLAIAGARRELDGKPEVGDAAALPDAQRHRQLLLREPPRLAPPTKDVTDLARRTDELLHGAYM